MVNVCIVEDEIEQASLLKNYITKYGEDSGQQFNITYLPDGIDLVDEYKSQFDIIRNSWRLLLRIFYKDDYYGT